MPFILGIVTISAAFAITCDDLASNDFAKEVIIIFFLTLLFGTISCVKPATEQVFKEFKHPAGL